MLTIFTKIKEFFLGKPQAPVAETPVTEAPYKIEAPTPEVVTVVEAPTSTYVAPTLKVVNGSTPKVSNKPRERAKPRAKPVATKPVVAQTSTSKPKGQTTQKPASSRAKPKITK